jgi:hypothetical protein
MLQSVGSKGMTQSQVELVEHALREVTRIAPPSWGEIPMRLHPAFARYMDRDVWTGGPDLLTLREAALLILRDAITRSGEFAENNF